MAAKIIVAAPCWRFRGGLGSKSLPAQLGSFRIVFKRKHMGNIPPFLSTPTLYPSISKSISTPLLACKEVSGTTVNGYQQAEFFQRRRPTAWMNGKSCYSRFLAHGVCE